MKLHIHTQVTYAPWWHKLQRCYWLCVVICMYISREITRLSSLCLIKGSGRDVTVWARERTKIVAENILHGPSSRRWTSWTYRFTQLLYGLASKPTISSQRLPPKRKFLGTGSMVPWEASAKLCLSVVCSLFLSHFSWCSPNGIGSTRVADSL